MSKKIAPPNLKKKPVSFSLRGEIVDKLKALKPLSSFPNQAKFNQHIVELGIEKFIDNLKKEDEKK